MHGEKCIINSSFNPRIMTCGKKAQFWAKNKKIESWKWYEWGSLMSEFWLYFSNFWGSNPLPLGTAGIVISHQIWHCCKVPANPVYISWSPFVSADSFLLQQASKSADFHTDIDRDQLCGCSSLHHGTVANHVSQRSNTNVNTVCQTTWCHTKGLVLLNKRDFSWHTTLLAFITTLDLAYMQLLSIPSE